MDINKFAKSEEIKTMLEETRLAVAKDSSLKKHLEEMCYVIQTGTDSTITADPTCKLQ